MLENERQHEDVLALYLEELMLHPFRLVDQQTDKGAPWNVAGEMEISVYTYMSFLGAGGFSGLLSLLIQLVVPICLLFISVRNTDRDIQNDVKAWCPADGNVLAKLLLFCVVLLYLSQIVPKTLVTFFRTAGSAQTPLRCVASRAFCPTHTLTSPCSDAGRLPPTSRGAAPVLTGPRSRPLTRPRPACAAVTSRCGASCATSTTTAR